MKFITSLFNSALISALTLAVCVTPVHSQTLEAEGVVGDQDRQSRNPHLSVGVTAGKNQVTILADAFHPSDEFQKYPIQFEFYVNRTLFATQYRSVKLPGPIGVTVPSTVAKVPFNYVVVAKVLHPNSVYTTVIEGAATADSDGRPPTTPEMPAGTLNCTVTVAGAEEGDEVVYTASDVALDQESDTAYGAEFSAESEDGLKAEVSAKVSLASGAGDSTGVVTVTEEGEDAVKISGKAVIETDEDAVTKVTITSTDGKSSLNCAK